MTFWNRLATTPRMTAVGSSGFSRSSSFSSGTWLETTSFRIRRVGGMHRCPASAGGTRVTGVTVLEPAGRGRCSAHLRGE